MEGKELKRTRCEVYSRVVGYLTPVSQWNKGKKAEFGDRKTFDHLVKDESNCRPGE
ncbi:MAG TPA: anaerobic ribonucleoside-triphosphate reductase [Synergistales bacterium]|nr:anaerobic ribonucleoside-triphosphate reductase [Synergistales bacterium]